MPVKKKIVKGQKSIMVTSVSITLFKNECQIHDMAKDCFILILRLCTTAAFHLKIGAPCWHII